MPLNPLFMFIIFVSLLMFFKAAKGVLKIMLWAGTIYYFYMFLVYAGLMDIIL